MSVKAQAAKWDKVVKKMDIEDEIAQVKEQDFEQQQQAYMEKMMGCSKDHSKEIDLYDKPYCEKIERIVTMKGQAEAAVIDADAAVDANDAGEETKTGEEDGSVDVRGDLLQKASYYY